MEEILLQYGALGAMLLYFIWKDSKTFELYKSTLKQIVDEMKLMREEQNVIKKDVEDIKNKIQ